MNKAQLIGRLSKDPELRTTALGISVCTFTVAVNRGFGDKKETDFLPVVAWRALAENCAKFLAKGKKAGVSGRIQTRSYDTDSGKRYITEIVADDVEFLSPKNDPGALDDRDREPADFDPDIVDIDPDEELGPEVMPF